MVPHLPGVVGQNPLGVNHPRHRQAVLHLLVGDGVAPGQGASGLQHLFAAAPENLAQDVQVHLLRKTDDVQRRFHFAPHGVDVAEGVGGGHLPEKVGVVQHGWEEVQGLDDGQVIGEAVHGGVVAGLGANEQIGVGGPGQLLQHPAQGRRAQLGGASTASAKLQRLTHETHLVSRILSPAQTDRCR